MPSSVRPSSFPTRIRSWHMSRALANQEETSQRERAQTRAALFPGTETGANGARLPPRGQLQDVRGPPDRCGGRRVCCQIATGSRSPAEELAVDHRKLEPDRNTM